MVYRFYFTNSALRALTFDAISSKITSVISTELTRFTSVNIFSGLAPRNLCVGYLNLK